MPPIKFIECPRDAMQGIKEFIPTEKKVEYINALLRVGFDTIDAGSFVSAKAIPQMSDTTEVLARLDMKNTKSKLLAIVANTRGAEEACKFRQITYLGFPFSISETFQQRNANSSIEQSLARVAEIQNLCIQHRKQLVVYISMAFGNPYGDTWNKDIAIKWTEKLVNEIGVKIISLADTIGVADPDNISYLFSNLLPAFPGVEFGAHLHTAPGKWQEKIEAAVSSGCNRFDTAINGYGGCPMAADKLVGNMPTENLVSYFESKGIETGLNMTAFSEAQQIASKIFPA